MARSSKLILIRWNRLPINFFTHVVLFVDDVLGHANTAILDAQGILRKQLAFFHRVTEIVAFDNAVAAAVEFSSIFYTSASAILARRQRVRPVALLVVLTVLVQGDRDLEAAHEVAGAVVALITNALEGGGIAVRVQNAAPTL